MERRDFVRPNASLPSTGMRATASCQHILLSDTTTRALSLESILSLPFLLHGNKIVSTSRLGIYVTCWSHLIFIFRGSNTYEVPTRNIGCFVSGEIGAGRVATNIHFKSSPPFCTTNSAKCTVLCWFPVNACTSLHKYRRHTHLHVLVCDPDYECLWPYSSSVQKAMLIKLCYVLAIQQTHMKPNQIVNVRHH